MPKRTKSGRYSQQWKAVERAAAAALKGQRISRGDNFSREDVDVIVADFPELRIDCKYRVKHAHHTFMREIEEKYITEPGQEPVLITKHHRQEGAFVTVRLDFFARLLDVVRFAGKSPNE